MIGTYELTVLWLGVALTLGCVGVCLYHRCFFRYFFLNLYLLASISFTVGCWYLIGNQGYGSASYFYFYYVGDALFNVLGYLLIASFFDHMFRYSVFRSYVRPTLAIFFLLVVGVSALFISGGVERMRVLPRFVVEFEQNMFFVGVLLTFLLWISMSYLRAESRRFVLLVSGLGIYFSSHAANYALQFLVPDSREILTRVPPLAYCFMVLVWLYTFLRVPEGVPAVEPVPREVPVKVHIHSE